MLRTSLTVLSQILEVACLSDIGKYAEEFLSYLKTTITLEATDTVQCVQQVWCSVYYFKVYIRSKTNLSNAVVYLKFIFRHIFCERFVLLVKYLLLVVYIYWFWDKKMICVEYICFTPWKLPLFLATIQIRAWKFLIW